ncbi:MAG: hypothetical protein QXR13_01545 [Candidatus Bathyarchaeia archaeon]
MPRETYRKILLEDIILEAVSNPSQVYYDLSTGATIATKGLNGRHILVAYIKEDGEVKVITTFITSEVQEIIRRKMDSGRWVRVK